MLSLSQEVGGDPGRLGGIIGHDHGFSRPGQAIQSHLTKDLLLGQRDKQVARANDFVYTRDALRAKGQRGNRLRAADLGIELAASWAHEYTFEQIAEEVQRNLEFLHTSVIDVPVRHRSLWACFEHSWDLLSESEREVFSKLAVFPGSFSGKAAQEVAGAAQPWLVRLEDKSLVRADTSYPRAAYGRYALHPLLKQYARQKLHQYSRKIEDQARQQHAQYFCSFLKAREMDLKGLR